MSHLMVFAFRRAIRDEQGQALPWMVLLIVLFLGMAGLTLDLGHAYVSYRELQASTDAAAMAGAMELASPTATEASIKAAVKAYSSASGGANVNSNLPSASIDTTLQCLATVESYGSYCASSTTGYNALKVVQTTTIPTYFIQALKVFGVKSATSLTLNSTATAAMRGGQNDQYNIAILIDTTPSMADRDNSCPGSTTKIGCALAGVQTLLQAISPCTASTSSAKATCVPYDSVSLFTFPNIRANTVTYDTTCNSRTSPTYMSYTTPVPGAVWSAPTGTSATYQITNFLSDFSSTNSAGGDLSTTSYLSIAAGVGSCNGLKTGGNVATYFAGAIYAAQSALMAAQYANSGTKNAMIILTDGDANNATINATGTNEAGSTSTITNQDGTQTPFSYTVNYPGPTKTTTTDRYGHSTTTSANNNCQQAIDATNNAKAQGTTVYTVAYASLSSSGCSTDTSGALAGLSACDTVQKMATDMDHFYSDNVGGSGNCSATTTKSLTTLSEIFGNIAGGMQKPRLIPNGTT